jgi:hypothetical protein
LLEGLAKRQHHLRVSSEGFQNWESSVMFDGKPRQIVAELKPAIKQDTDAIPRPSFQTIPDSSRHHNTLRRRVFYDPKLADKSAAAAHLANAAIERIGRIAAGKIVVFRR